MVICFEEKDRKVIESKGMMIIEFKQILYKGEKSIKTMSEVLEEFANKIEKAWNVLAERFFEVIDNVRLLIESVKDYCHYPTSSRYKIVKVFSKCTGTNIYFGWKITRKIKQWLARSHC